MLRDVKEPDQIPFWSTPEGFFLFFTAALIIVLLVGGLLAMAGGD
jgi:hypothetical protein